MGYASAEKCGQPQSSQHHMKQRQIQRKSSEKHHQIIIEGHSGAKVELRV